MTNPTVRRSLLRWFAAYPPPPTRVHQLENKVKTLTFTLVGSLMLVAVAHAAPGQMQPGLWEITTRMEMPGMPMTMPAQIKKHCYTKQDVESGIRTAPRADDKNCVIKNYKVKGNTASWDVACTGKDGFTGSAVATTTSTSYSGQMKMKMKHDGETMETTHLWIGKRVGDCKK